MRRKLVLGFWVCLLAVGTLLLAEAATYELNNGTTLAGDILSVNAQGLIVKRSDGTIAERVPWTNFAQSALKDLAKNAQAKKFVETLVEEDFDEPEAAARRKALEITVKTPPRMDRPDPKASFGALFSSPVSVTMLILIYLAGIYAAYEIAVFRNRPPALVCLIAAVAPVIGPLIFLLLPTYIPPEPEEVPSEGAADYVPQFAAAGTHAAQQAAQQAAAAPAAGHHAAGKGPAAQVYSRGQFTFNRRFFETKLAGFMRMVPSEAERDMLIHIKSARGEHAGNRVVRVTPNELYLQVAKGNASEEVLIPFAEIAEIQIRHKDA